MESSNAGFRGSEALLVELEDKVAQTAADVQNAQSEVGKKAEAKLSWAGTSHLF